jgi:hypothetical protein
MNETGLDKTRSAVMTSETNKDKTKEAFIKKIKNGTFSTQYPPYITSKINKM